MSRHTSSPRERINIYIGNIRKLTGDCADKKHAQSICGRRLLAYGLLDTGCREIFRERAPWEEVSEYLERIMQRGEQGKPYFPAFPSVFLISAIPELMRPARWQRWPADWISRRFGQ